MKSFWCLEQISYVNLVYIYNFEQVNAKWAENYFPNFLEHKSIKTRSPGRLQLILISRRGTLQ